MLVIIGLIVGGILVGQDLVKASQLRDIIARMDQYTTAVNIFRLKYDCIPGDCTKATQFFGDRGSTCLNGADWATYLSPATCNGNGDKRIGQGSGHAHVYHERLTFWSHLSHANLLDTIYTGVGSGGWFGQVAGVNTPNDWRQAATTVTSSNTVNGLYVVGNPILGGGVSNGYVSHHDIFSAAFTVQELYSIDNKIDDGRPQRGKIWNGIFPGYVDERCTTNNTPGTNYYKMDTTGMVCSLQYYAVFN